MLVSTKDGMQGDHHHHEALDDNDVAHVIDHVDHAHHADHHIEHVHNEEEHGPEAEEVQSKDDVNFHEQGAVGGAPVSENSSLTSHSSPVLNHGHASHEPSTSGLPCPSFELSWQSFNISGVSFSSPAFRNFQDYNIGQSASQHEFSPKIRTTIRKPSARGNSVINRDFTGEKKLRLASNLNELDTVQKLLDDGIDPKSFDNRQRTALHFAACKGHTLIGNYSVDPMTASNH